MKIKPDAQFPNLIACYDSGGSGDRYTVVFLNDKQGKGHCARTMNETMYGCIGMSAEPFHPQGICQHSTAMLGKHLGKRINFTDLPNPCQLAVLRDINSEVMGYYDFSDEEWDSFSDDVKKKLIDKYAQE